ncbi:hypothetical protein [Microbacterium sp. H1-D42]|uniref:hypothetical protein n=1 Tax=Microbacterium sp. H1-D42 TaxID=2925844 RepID=UPI001F538A82|nr:hypothetical protein [Microbacterium sp. H1-D42]UNK70854.1 hypothetical protein MNR00_17140 [Microbacterium sp. H1-D42]
MNAAVRLTLYGAGLIVAFVVAFGLAGVVVPDSFVDDWVSRSSTPHGDEPAAPSEDTPHGGDPAAPSDEMPHEDQPATPSDDETHPAGH